jgi:glutaredoxin
VTPPAGQADQPVRVLLLTRPGCHLCDEARAVIGRVTAELGVQFREKDINDDPEDLRQYSDSVPVTFVDGIQHDFWRVSEDRLRTALTR